MQTCLGREFCDFPIRLAVYSRREVFPSGLNQLPAPDGHRPTQRESSQDPGFDGEMACFTLKHRCPLGLILLTSATQVERVARHSARVDLLAP